MFVVVVVVWQSHCRVSTCYVISLFVALGGHPARNFSLKTGTEQWRNTHWTRLDNARGLRDLGGPKPDPKLFFLYVLIFQVLGVYSTLQLIFCERPLSHFIIVLCLMVILVSTVL